MRSTDEQLQLVRSRAAKLRKRRQSLLRSGAMAACFLLAAALGPLLPLTEGSVGAPEALAYGSLILSSPLLSYIVVAILAFALGILITLLCVGHRAAHGIPEEEDK